MQGTDIKNMAEVPIIKLHDTLIVSVQFELDDHTAVQLLDSISERIRKTGAKAVVLDISALEVVDTFVTRVFKDIGSTGRIMGSNVVLVGMKPAIAMTLVEMGANFEGLETAINLEAALRKIELLEQENEEEPDDDDVE